MSSVPFMLDREIEELQSFDIGLMPLPDTEWTRGKCAFKAIQYMASGVPVVASPVGITTDLIHHDKNGLLATSAVEWFSELGRLVHDASLRQRLALSARHTIEDLYSLERWGPRVVELLDQISSVNRKQLDIVAA
jgi:glycosyltransferase involved in cell wall biosynthesis